MLVQNSIDNLSVRLTHHIGEDTHGILRHAIGHKWHHLTEIRRTIHTHIWETAINAIEAISPIVHSWD